MFYDSKVALTTIEFIGKKHYLRCDGSIKYNQVLSLCVETEDI